MHRDAYEIISEKCSLMNIPVSVDESKRHIYPQFSSFHDLDVLTYYLFTNEDIYPEKARFNPGYDIKYLLMNKWESTINNQKVPSIGPCNVNMDPCPWRIGSILRVERTLGPFASGFEEYCQLHLSSEGHQVLVIFYDLLMVLIVCVPNDELIPKPLFRFDVELATRCEFFKKSHQILFSSFPFLTDPAFKLSPWN
ncbi:hypothetical protein RF11_05019 [Thelohanellus kitauei]|uniref:Uncharacterized protein n=1 Tax=Thelohanellus kitauei TaxID=669202 RepID=A0A0C2MBY0_THEKT|nr:hypothetical protein RF11_05019 [Thelohanellus kitauei]